jgi:ribosomal protein L29
MKSKDKKELQIKKTEELKKMLTEAEKSLLTAQLDNKQSKLKNTRSIFTIRKQIAVIKTILNMKAREEVRANS